MKPRYSVGTRVRVQNRHPATHVRTPYYIRGHTGVISAIVGAFPNPEQLAYRGDGEPNRTLYRVCFRQADLWSKYTGTAADTATLDLYEHWLDPFSSENG